MPVSRRTIREAKMSTLSLRANLLLAVAAAIGLAVAMGMPWYGPVAQTDTATIDHLYATVESIFSRQGATAHEALGAAGTALVALAAVMIISAALCLAPALEDGARVGLHMSAIASVALILYKLFDQPGDNAAVDLRYGLFVALAAAGVAMSAGGAVAGKQKLRKPPARMVDLHTASGYFDNRPAG
jgi:hypothetical protein